MSALTLTITRTDTTKPWFVINPSTVAKYFTKAEIDEILLPSKAELEALPGLTDTRIQAIDSLTTSIIFIFNTLEEATAAKTAIVNPIENSLLYKRQQLLRAKELELGFDYIHTAVVS